MARSNKKKLSRKRTTSKSKKPHKHTKNKINASNNLKKQRHANQKEKHAS